MREPFYRSSSALNTIAVIVAVIAIIIFISSCLLNVYAYVANPTATATATSTPTITNTPRPSSTPTVTVTPTVTRTALSPTVRATTQVTEPVGGSILMETFAERGYACEVEVPAPDVSEMTCIRQENGYSYRMEITIEESLTSMRITVFPYNQAQTDEVTDELIWLAQTPSRFSWLYQLEATSTVTATATSTLQTQEPDPIEMWIAETLPQLTAEISFEETFDDLVYSLEIQDQRLVLLIDPIEQSAAE